MAFIANERDTASSSDSDGRNYLVFPVSERFSSSPFSAGVAVAAGSDRGGGGGGDRHEGPKEVHRIEASPISSVPRKKRRNNEKEKRGNFLFLLSIHPLLLLYFSGKKYLFYGKSKLIPPKRRVSSSHSHHSKNWDHNISVPFL